MSYFHHFILRLYNPKYEKVVRVPRQIFICFLLLFKKLFGIYRKEVVLFWNITLDFSFFRKFSTILFFLTHGMIFMILNWYINWIFHYFHVFQKIGPYYLLFFTFSFTTSKSFFSERKKKTIPVNKPYNITFCFVSKW